MNQHSAELDDCLNFRIGIRRFTNRIAPFVRLPTAGRTHRHNCGPIHATFKGN